MIDLCIDARMAFSSGIGTYIREIVPYFRHSRFRPVLLVDQIGRDWCKEFDQILFDPPIYSLREQLFYPIKIPRCSLFWSPHYNVPLLPIRAKKRVATIHDACHLAFGTKAMQWYAKWVMSKAIDCSERVLTVSQFSKEEIERRLGKGHLDVIPIGVNLSRFMRRAPDETIRAKYRLPDRFVLFVGNQKPHKNAEGLVRAFSKSKISHLELVIVGRGTERGEVDEVDLPALYSMATTLVFPSLYEGFGLPPLEAMSCGCPTVVSKAASIPEVCGDASLYFDPLNEDEMASAILQVVESPQLWIEKGFERIKQFSWKESAERHIRLFEEICYA